MLMVESGIWIEQNTPNKKKKSKIAAVPTHVPLEALYLVVGGLIVPLKENAVCTVPILDFLSCHYHYKGVKPFQKGVTAGNDPKCVGSFILTQFIS